MKTYNIKLIMLILLPILVIPLIGVAHAQTASEIDVAAGAGSSSQASCVATNNCFSPNPLTVAPGTTVTWKNTDTTTHVVCSGKVTDAQCGTVFEYDSLKSGQTFQFTFANAGTFDYYCSVHPWMTGQVIVGASGTVPTPQPTPPTISITTDRQSYSQGDTLVISGKVSQPDSSTSITLRITNPSGNLISEAQLLPSSDGSFTKSVVATGPLWKDSGTYTIVAQYGPYIKTNTTFYYNGGDGSSTVTKAINSTYSLQVGGQTYSIPYIIKGGTVSSMNVLAQQYIFETTVNTNADGSLTVMLPRSLIDAKTNSDINFIVTVNGVSITQFTETTSSTVRVLSIPFHNGDTKIDIVGTQSASSSTSNSNNPYLGCSDCNNNQHTQLSSSGTLKVGLSMDPINPNTTGQTQLKINFMNKQDSTIQPHIDYKVNIIQGSNQIFGIPVTHTALGSVTIPIQFQNSGTYQIIVEVDGILFQPIPPESTTFSLQVGTRQNNLSQSSTPTPQQDMQDVNQAKANQIIAAEVNIGNDKTETKSIDNSVSVQTTSTTPDSLGVKVSAPDQTGPKVIVFNLNATTINVTNLKDLGVMYDGKLISPAPNMDAILHAKPTDNPSFAIVVTQSGVQVLVLVPHFSTHTITLTNMSKVIPAVPEFGPIVGIITIMSLIGSIIISRRFFKV